MIIPISWSPEFSRAPALEIFWLCVFHAVVVCGCSAAVICISQCSLSWPYSYCMLHCVLYCIAGPSMVWDSSGIHAQDCLSLDSFLQPCWPWVHSVTVPGRNSTEFLTEANTLLTSWPYLWSGRCCNNGDSAFFNLPEIMPPFFLVSRVHKSIAFSFVVLPAVCYCHLKTGSRLIA